MFGKFCRLVFLTVVAVTGLACNKDLTTTDMQMARMEEARNDPHAHFTYMVDNATVQDMSLADFHFVAHTNELSGTGVARLDRLAHFLDTYGGTVRYETYLMDEELVAQRLEHVREYLVLTGCNMERVDITTMISGGRGMAATKAIEIDDKGTKPAGEEGGGTSIEALAGS